MKSTTRLMALTICAVALAVVMVLAFSWAGPGLANIASPASAQVLFDEEKVADIYEQASPAVVELSIDRRAGGAFSQRGTGSGFLIDKEGHIATNNHVVDGADRVRVTFHDGKTAKAVVLGRNLANDLALVKVDPAEVAGIEPLALGNSGSVRPGQLAIAVGSPVGLNGSVTVGVISGVNRDLPSDLRRSIVGVLQTDALINPGNSGGPLLDSKGQVVGINSAIQVSRVSTSGRNIGFAVPINTLDTMLPRLKEGQVIQPAWLGIASLSLDPMLAETLKLSQTRGAYVTGVVTGSPAAKAGVIAAQTDSRGRPDTEGDTIVAVDGVAVDSVNGLIGQLNLHRGGAKITLTIVRGGSRMDVPVTLADWPDNSEATPRIRPQIPRFPGGPFP